MTDQIGLSYGMVIGEDADGKPVKITLDFFAALQALAERTGGTAVNRTPKIWYQATEPADWTDGDQWYDTDDAQRRLYRRENGVATLLADQTSVNRAAGLVVNGTITTAAGGSPRAGIQPVTQQIHDGQVLTWGPYDATPTLTIDASPLPALAAGEQYELAITGASATGGTASLKKRTAGGTLTTQTGTSVTTVATDPGSFDIHKPTVGDAYNGVYNFNITYSLFGSEIPTEDGDIIVGDLTVGVYYRTTAGGGWTLAGSRTFPAVLPGLITGYTATLSMSGLPAIGQHVDPEFRVEVLSRTTTPSNLTALNSVSYETISGGSTSTATPSNNPKLTLRIDPK